MTHQNMQENNLNMTDPHIEDVEIGHVVTVGASKALASINPSAIRNGQLHLAELGTILKIITRESIVVAMVSSLEIGGKDNEGMNDGCIAQLDILGELATNQTTKETRFMRGVRSFPVLNQPVRTMTKSDLQLIFERVGKNTIHVGHLQQDSQISAKLQTNDLLSKHFAIIGSTGSGKSCTVALVLQAILKENTNAHIVLFDPHNEYSRSFGPLGHVIRSDNLDLPLWMFNFEEATELLTSDLADQAKEEIEILHELILKSKLVYDRMKSSSNISSTFKLEDVEQALTRSGAHISLDSPVPYRVRDLLKLIEIETGKLENTNNLGPYLRLKRRINMLMNDPRYEFVFRNQAAPSSIENILGQIFRIPVQGKPISILDFSSIPSESLNIVVSVISRLAFDLAVWSGRNIPILLVCEEAHRYIPSNPNLGFASTRKSISRIAKEGRKYGVSLAIISQRPSELEPSTLSQCSTIISMRLNNELDQNFVKAAVPNGAAELLSFLPALGTAEAMIFGESVAMPMRVILNNLPEEYRPHSSSAEFTELWQYDRLTPDFMARVFDNWRTRSPQTDIQLPPMQPNSAPIGFQPAQQQPSMAPTQPSMAPIQNQPPPIARPSAQHAHDVLAQTLRQQELVQAQLGTSNAPGEQSLAEVKKILTGAVNRNS